MSKTYSTQQSKGKDMNNECENSMFTNIDQD